VCTHATAVERPRPLHGPVRRYARVHECFVQLVGPRLAPLLAQVARGRTAAPLLDAARERLLAERLTLRLIPARLHASVHEFPRPVCTTILTTQLGIAMQVRAPVISPPCPLGTLVGRAPCGQTLVAHRASEHCAAIFARRRRAVPGDAIGGQNPGSCRTRFHIAFLVHAGVKRAMRPPQAPPCARAQPRVAVPRDAACQCFRRQLVASVHRNARLDTAFVQRLRPHLAALGAGRWAAVIRHTGIEHCAGPGRTLTWRLAELAAVVEQLMRLDQTAMHTIPVAPLEHVCLSSRDGKHTG